MKEKGGYDPEGDDNLLIKLGLDSGRGFLKLCLTMEELEKSEEFVMDMKRKLTHHQKFKNGGVKHLLVLTIVEDCIKNYHNVNVLMNIVGVNTLSFSKSISVHLKMDNLLLGMQSHGAKYPCAWCFGSATFIEDPHQEFWGSLKNCRKSSIQKMGDKATKRLPKIISMSSLLNHYSCIKIHTSSKFSFEPSKIKIYDPLLEEKQLICFFHFRILTSRQSYFNTYHYINMKSSLSKNLKSQK